MKSKVKFLIVLGIAFTVFTLLYFVIPYTHKNNSVYVLGYVFSSIAFLAQIYAFYKGFDKDETLKSKFYGFPILKVGIIYLLVQVSVTFVFCLLNAFMNVPTWIPIIIYAVIVGIFVIGFISAETYKEEIEKAEVEEKNSTLFMDDLRTNAKSFYNRIEQSPLKNKMKELYDIIQYSDPVSSVELVEAEDEISRKFNALKMNYLEKNYAEVEVGIEELITLMEERNYRCRILK